MLVIGDGGERLQQQLRIQKTQKAPAATGKLMYRALLKFLVQRINEYVEGSSCTCRIN